MTPSRQACEQSPYVRTYGIEHSSGPIKQSSKHLRASRLQRVRRIPATMTHLHSHQKGTRENSNTNYANVLVVLTCLSVILLSHEKENIPSHELLMATFLAAAVAIRVLWVRIFQQMLLRRGNRKLSSSGGATPFQLPAHSLQISQHLMLQEVVWTILVPWIWLFLDHNNSSTLLRMATSNQTVGYFVAPHLFFFQVQIVLESVLQVTFIRNDDPSHRFLLFHYTAVVNAYRGVAVGVTLLRSLYALPDLQLNNFHQWWVVAVLPSVTTLLWLYSSFIFLPLHWYPALLWADHHRRSTNDSNPVVKHTKKMEETTFKTSEIHKVDRSEEVEEIEQ